MSKHYLSDGMLHIPGKIQVKFLKNKIQESIKAEMTDVHKISSVEELIQMYHFGLAFLVGYQAEHLCGSLLSLA